MANEHDEQQVTATPAQMASPSPATAPEAGAATAALASGMGNAAFSAQLPRAAVTVGSPPPPARPAVPALAPARLRRGPRAGPRGP